MNRTFSSIAVLSLMLFAVAICVKQTIDFRELIAGSTSAMLLSAEGISAGLLIASAFRCCGNGLHAGKVQSAGGQFLQPFERSAFDADTFRL